MEVDASMVKPTVKRTRELRRLWFCPFAKSNLSHLILMGKVARRNCGAPSPNWQIIKSSLEITLAKCMEDAGPALCSFPQDAVLLQGAASSAGAL